MIFGNEQWMTKYIYNVIKILFTLCNVWFLFHTNKVIYKSEYHDWLDAFQYKPLNVSAIIIIIKDMPFHVQFISGL